MASHSTQVPALTSDQQSLAESEKSKSVVSQESSTVDVKKQNLAEFAPAPARLADIFLPRSKRAVVDLDAVATQPSVFDDPVAGKYYLPSEDWENTKNFDVDLRWSWREEKAIVRIIDRKVLLWACIFFASLNLDRNNLAAANSDNFLKDLNMTTNDYNLGTTLFRAMFLFAELPGQIISKRVGPDVFVPIQMCSWALITLFQFFLSGRTSFLVARSLLGLVQGSFIPDLLLYLSYFYKTSELPIRLGFFWVAMNATSFLSTFFSYGVLHMRGVGGYAGFRFLFLLEGIITFLIGLLAFVKMRPGPSQTKSVWSKNGWFDERQTKIAVTRVLRDDRGKSTMHNRQGLSLKMLWKTLSNVNLWPIYIVGITFGIPASPIQQYLTLSLRNLGFSTFKTNLLSSVQYAAAIFTGIGVVVLSEILDERALVAMAEDLWILPFLAAIYALPNAAPWAYYGLATALLSNPYVHPIQAAWISGNAGDVETRTIAASIYNMCVQAGSIISANIYRQDDAPRYKKGNTVLLTICCVNLALYAFAKVFYVKVNARRERKWSAMSAEERDHYLNTTKDEGNRRLDFRFIH